MIRIFCFWNSYTISSRLWLLIFYSLSVGNTINASQRYPHSFWRCCEARENATADGNTTSSDGTQIGKCGSEGSEVLLLPKGLFPEISSESEHVELVLRNPVEKLMCAERQDNLDISIDLADNETSKPFRARGNKGVAEVTFSGSNYLAADGKIYSRRHFCVSGRSRNKTRLAIRTCKRWKCSKSRPCIPRCCGGQQSILISPPTSHTASLADFCSKLTLEKNPWNPWASKILRVDNRTDFYQTRYVPRIEGDERQSNQQKHCRLFRVKLKDELSLDLLEDGSLQVTAENKTDVLENFCVDGINGGTVGKSLGDTQSPAEEVVVVYDCRHPAVGGTSAVLQEPIHLPACRDLAHPPDQLIQLPQRIFPSMNFEREDTVAVKLTTRKNGSSVDCEKGHENRTLDFNGTGNYLEKNGRLILDGSALYLPSQYCVRSVLHNALGLRTCKWIFSVKSKLLPEREEWFVPIEMLAFIISGLFYVAIAVVYILRKEKDLVLRCSIPAFCISMTLLYVLKLLILFYVFTSYPLTSTAIFITGNFIKILEVYGFSWMSVLCFDVWLNVTFLRSGIRTTKRLWGYVVFTSTLPLVYFGVVVLKETNAFFGLINGLLCVNFLLFLATAVKLWIAQQSSDFRNRKKTFLLCFKLFLLVGFRSVIDFLAILKQETESRLMHHVAYVLQLLHPIVLFFFLVWDAEAKNYLESNYPRVKRALDLIYAIGYPVRKGWGLCRRCKRGTNGNGEIELEFNSTNIYVHTRQDQNIPQ